MSGKPVLPPIDDELERPRQRVNLRAIRPKGQADDNTVEENSRRLGSEWSASTSLPGSESISSALDASRPPLASLRIEVPAYLDDELTQKAAAQRVTKQFLVLTALRQAGYHIEDADLVADKRRARRKM
jgi:hypothetical protein